MKSRNWKVCSTSRQARSHFNGQLKMLLSIFHLENQNVCIRRPQRVNLKSNENDSSWEIGKYHSINAGDRWNMMLRMKCATPYSWFWQMEKFSIKFYVEHFGTCFILADWQNLDFIKRVAKQKMAFLDIHVTKIAISSKAQTTTTCVSFSFFSFFTSCNECIATIKQETFDATATSTCCQQH